MPYLVKASNMAIPPMPKSSDSQANSTLNSEVSNGSLSRSEPMTRISTLAAWCVPIPGVNAVASWPSTNQS
ncbi:unnamed protein product [Penicillium salamii]|nr:unnamed protein product [Penicillium salamii]CAG8222515.1 unnamed protein product [Penicillium salamii]CAG8311152.1 unnamed protein product [Penicillium salamii]CAG8319280.1 unnamed protein product [Penicillium salamii]CAG8348254.1 unnamed protein product [Penicillium salamii]